MLSLNWLFDFSVGARAFVIGLDQIFSFFSTITKSRATYSLLKGQGTAPRRSR